MVKNKHSKRQRCVSVKAGNEDDVRTVRGKIDPMEEKRKDAAVKTKMEQVRATGSSSHGKLHVSQIWADRKLLVEGLGGHCIQQ